MGVAGLVLLRLVLGWHFLYEGCWKLKHPGFSSAGFFKQSRGPYADWFKKQIVPSEDGQTQLDYDEVRIGWDKHRRAFIEHYGLSGEDSEQTLAIFKRYESQLLDYLTTGGDRPGLKPEFAGYLAEFKKLQEAKAAPGAGEIPFQRKRLADKENELKKQAAPWIAFIEGLEAEYRRDLLNIVERSEGLKNLRPMAASSTRLEQIDRWTGWFLVAVGGCLILGLASRLASLAGAGFLTLVVLSHLNYPGVFPEPHPSEGHALFIDKNAVEAIALFALAMTPVGRWGGLDFILYHGVFCRIFGRKVHAPEQ